MKVLFLDQFSDLGGAQRCLLDLLPSLKQRGWRTVVAAPGRGELFERSSAFGAKVERLPDLHLSSGAKSVSDVWRFAGAIRQSTGALRQLIDSCRPDLLYVNGPRMLPLAALARPDSLPVIFHAHSYLNQANSSAVARWAIRRCRATLVASCLYAAGPLLDAVPPSRRRLVYNGVSDLGFRRVPSYPMRRIGVVGRVAPEKGQDVFIDAAKLLARRTPECRFVVIGSPLFQNPASDRYFERLRKQCDGSCPVEFAGWESDIAATMASLDLLVVPSTGVEATTRVIPEAWSAGVPVVASRTGGIAEIVEDGATGFLVKPGCPAALAQRIGEVWALSEQRLNEVRLAARRRYLECFTVERFRAQVSEIIEGAAAGSLRLNAHVM